jgi:hypothetical protein
MSPSTIANLDDPVRAIPHTPRRAFPNAPRRMTRAEFEDFLIDRLDTLSGLSGRRGQILVPAPYVVVECGCGDVNCHGWRIVPQVG